MSICAASPVSGAVRDRRDLGVEMTKAPGGGQRVLHQQTQLRVGLGRAAGHREFALQRFGAKRGRLKGGQAMQRGMGFDCLIGAEAARGAQTQR